MFYAGTALAWLVCVAAAWRGRGRPYWIFVAVILGIYSLLAMGIWAWTGPAWPAALYLHAAVYLHYLALNRPRMRPLWYRALVSLPALTAVAAAALCLPLLPLVWLGAPAWLLLLPAAIALGGLAEGFLSRREEVDLALDGSAAGELGRAPRGEGRQERPLRIVQLADPHLGPFMSEARLTRICEAVVEEDPDLVLLTGDFLTMEAKSDPEVLRRALAPLSALAGRCFACYGNHDLENPDLVRAACEAARVRLLVDDEATADTPAGPVQIVGFNYRFKERREHAESLCARFPRREGHLRLMLIHDPGAFTHVPDGDCDLALSGHTHGGQLGLLRLGLDATIVSTLGKVPDHGFWAEGQNRLYVHRGHGHYGFPLRIGVPREESVIRVHQVG